MRFAAAIAMMLGTMGCRQILGIDPGTVRADDAALEDTIVPRDEEVPIDMPIDMASAPWTNLAPVAGLAAGDQDPTLTGDMLEIYFSRGNRVFFATRGSITAAWSTPVVAGFQSGPSSDQTPEMSPEGLFLQFATDRGPGSGFDIFLTFRTNRTSSWGAPDSIAEINGNNVDVDDRPGSATANGARVTLSSDRDSMGLDLYEANRTGILGTPYETPVRIPLSGAGDDASPFLSGDGLTLYYASAPAGSSNRDLYVSTRTSLTEQFTTGTRIDELSTIANDSDPWVSPDGLHIYWMSDRDGSIRIWHASRGN